MKATPGRKYAQLVAGRCHWLFTHAELPEWNEVHIATVDVTDFAPQPQVGDLWNGASFSTPQPTVEELAEQQFAAKLTQDTEAAKANVKLRALVDMSPAEVDAWVTANVTNLAQVQDAIKTLAIGWAVVARRFLR